MRLLVTGGAGYIGGVAAAWLLEQGHDVAVLDRRAAARTGDVPAGAEVFPVDLLDAAALPAVFAQPYDGVLHFAALALVGESMQRPADYVRNNVVGTLNLLDAMRAAGVGQLVFSSTAATYGEPDRLPITEDEATRPTNAYGASKLAVDELLRFAAPAYGLAATSLRYFNVAGAYGRQRERHQPETHIIPNLLRAVAGDGGVFTLHGTDFPTADGTCVRDYVHVLDLVEAHLLALQAAAPGKHRSYNLGSGVGFSNREVVAAVEAATGRRVNVVEGPRRAGDPAQLVASNERIAAELGWAPQRPSLATMAADAWASLQQYGP